MIFRLDVVCICVGLGAVESVIHLIISITIIDPNVRALPLRDILVLSRVPNVAGLSVETGKTTTTTTTDEAAERPPLPPSQNPEPFLPTRTEWQKAQLSGR